MDKWIEYIVFGEIRGREMFIKGAFAAGTGGALAFFFGEISGLFIALVVFILLDFLTGITRGYIEKNLSSKLGKDGILKKGMIFMVIVLANIVDVYVIKTGEYLRNIVLMFYLAEEGLSILENLGACGVPVPQPLMKAIAALKDRTQAEPKEEDKTDEK
jgi:toxin secretion/phage lysis holin